MNNIEGSVNNLKTSEMESNHEDSTSKYQTVTDVPTHKEPTLLTLPSKIRRTIFRHLLLHEDISQLEKDFAPQNYLAILYTNKVINREASEVFYGENTFADCFWCEWARRWIIFHPRIKDMMQNLELTLGLWGQHQAEGIGRKFGQEMERRSEDTFKRFVNDFGNNYSIIRGTLSLKFVVDDSCLSVMPLFTDALGQFTHFRTIVVSLQRGRMSRCDDTNVHSFIRHALEPTLGPAEDFVGDDFKCLRFYPLEFSRVLQDACPEMESNHENSTSKAQPVANVPATRNKGQPLTDVPTKRKGSTLLALPPEIRHIIFRHLLLHDDLTQIYRNWPPRNYLAILNTNKMINREASEVFYGENTFVQCFWGKWAYRWIRFSPRIKDMMQNLEFTRVLWGREREQASQERCKILYEKFTRDFGKDFGNNHSILRRTLTLTVLVDNASFSLIPSFTESLGQFTYFRTVEVIIEVSKYGRMSQRDFIRVHLQVRTALEPTLGPAEEFLDRDGFTGFRFHPVEFKNARQEDAGQEDAGQEDD